nr:hypothetical protein [Tanacetum cinerariifolium]
MEIEPDIKNMMFNEYLEHEAERKGDHGRIFDPKVAQKGMKGQISTLLIVTRVDEILNVTMVDEEDDFNPTKDIEELEILLAKDPQLHFYKDTDFKPPCSSWDDLEFTKPVLNTTGFSAQIMQMEPDIENTRLNEYLEYEAEEERRSWWNVRSKSSPIRYEGVDFNSSHHDKSDVDNISDLEKEEAQEEDGNDGDIYDIWDITVEDVERIRQLLTPNVPDVMDDFTQPLIPKTIHTMPPNKDYVAPATKSILDELLKEFKDKILNVTMVDEETNFNPTKDIEELKRLLAKDPQSHFMEIQVHSVIIKPEPFIHTKPISSLYILFKAYKSSIKLYKVKRELTSPLWYDFYSPVPYPIAYLHPNGVYCYFHPQLISSEGIDTILPSK